MKSFRARPARFKKKIAELIGAALAEERDFAAAYAPIARKKFVKPQEKPQPEAPKKREVEVFDETTAEFAAALRLVSPEILDLIRGQFGAEPGALLRGAFEEEQTAAKPAAAEEPDAMSAELSGMDDAEEP
ncbi:MAG: hypothetical protein IKO42_02850, partial [Opitutales bacterium]|nr:hypothetical protein [Opitutales bacterium]